MSWLPEPGWGERLETFVIARGGLGVVSEGSKVSESAIKRYIKGDNEPGAFKLAAIARFCGTTVEEILCGPLQRTDVGARKTVERLADSNVDPTVDDAIAWIPLLDVIASAGTGISNPYPFEITRLPFPRLWLDQLGVPEEFVRFIPIRGDSMEPTVRDGAVGLVDVRFHAPKIEAIYVVVDDDDVRLKRIGRGMAGSLTLISDNERYPTDVLSSVDAARLKIAGRAFWAGGKI